MSASDDLGGLDSHQWRELCDCASRLEKTLLNGASLVDLRHFLPPPEAPHRQAVLYELVKTEIEARYRAGQGVPLEEFLKRYPELGSRDELPAGIIYEEYRVRRLYGDRPELGNYRDRFPRQFESVKQLLDQHPVPEPASSPKQREVSGYTTIRPISDESQVIPARPADNARQTEQPAPTPPRKDGTQAPSVPPTTHRISPELVLSGGQGYEKLEPLGHGEFGEVWRARAPGGVEVAIKIISRTLDHEASRRELKALEKLRQLRHPFLLQTHQYQAEKDHLVIVMELADGSLHDRFKECKEKGLQGIPVAELVAYFAQAAEALDYLHSRRVSHRDIKPQNLLMLHGYAKLADFGLARGQDQLLDDASIVCGTPYYMPPEAWKQQVSSHSDQYSLAATYVEMRLGRRLFPGRTLFEFAEQHIKSEPKLDPLPEAEQAVLRRALAKDPELRFPSCVAFARALQEAVMPKKIEPHRKPSWQLKALVGSIALTLIAVLAALGYLAFGKGPTSTNPEVKLWLPEGWTPENPTDVVEDPKSQRTYYRRLVREIGDERVVMVAIPQKSPSDPPIFYLMENKVWNGLYRTFMKDPAAARLFQKYRDRPGGEQWFRRGTEKGWEDGAWAPGSGGKSLGAGDGRGKIPVFRVKVTEAHCFAEWLGGRLPRQDQWLKATGRDEDNRPDSPFNGNAEGIAVNLGREGPWPVDKGDRDVSVYGCRQMAGNGKEWTRSVHDSNKDEIPLQQMSGARPVLVCGQSYAAREPLRFAKVAELDDKLCNEGDPEIGFRIVLEP